MSGCLVNRGVMECLVFAYLARTEKWKSLEWYGQAGSDLGRDIWGVCLRFVMEAPMESAITVKGQATIPKAIREHLGLKPGSGQVFRSSRWQRGSSAEASCIGFTRHHQIAASAAGDNRGNDAGRCRRRRYRYAASQTPTSG